MFEQGRGAEGVGRATTDAARSLAPLRASKFSPGFWLSGLGLGLRVWGVGFRVWGLGVRV